jgi:hypothetical protein
VIYGHNQREQQSKMSTRVLVLQPEVKVHATESIFVHKYCQILQNGRAPASTSFDHRDSKSMETEAWEI